MDNSTIQSADLSCNAVERSRLSHKEIIALDRLELSKKFPVFAPKGADKKPLKIGIRQELLARRSELGWGLKRTMRTLQDYFKGPKYHLAVARGGQRYGLDGSVAGEVTPEHQARAKEWLTNRAPGWLPRLGVVDGQ